jgi:hypothetical protein
LPDVIAADAGLNIWACEVKNGKYGGSTHHLERWMEILDFFQKAEDECTSAVRKFDEGSDRRELANALERLKEVFNQALTRRYLKPRQYRRC